MLPDLGRIPRAYFLGHQAAGLKKMKEMLSSVDLVIECRDYRVPATSQNPLLDGSLAGKERLIVYTKQDLGSEGTDEDRWVRGDHTSGYWRGCNRSSHVGMRYM